MLRIVQNERFTVEIDSENALLNCTGSAENTIYAIRSLISIALLEM